MARRSATTTAALLVLLLAACTPVQTDGIDPKGKAFDAVAPQERVTLTGTEPFWTLTVNGTQGLWVTPENQPGTRLALSRFSGNGGLGFSGMLEGQPFTATLTPGDCSDGMSERRYPFVGTIVLGGETREGCGYTDSQPFTGPATP
jgi:uncharacterized membrane protein